MFLILYYGSLDKYVCFFLLSVLEGLDDTPSESYLKSHISRVNDEADLMSESDDMEQLLDDEDNYDEDEYAL